MQLPSTTEFLTTRWNNILTVLLGLPTLAYAIAGLTSSLSASQGGFIGLALAGAVY